MLMAAVMLCGLLPVSAMATTTEQDPVDATTTPVVTEQPEATEQPAATETPAPSETVLPTEQPEETLPDEDTPTAGLPEEVVEPYALTYEELLANTMEEDQPFASGTLDSQNFRIPALVTLSDGTLVAAADARWNHTQDGQNTDTMVAVSDDNGQSWKVSLVNYFADTEDTQQSGAASFIDPALVAVGNTVYLLVDVLPGGVDDLNDCKEGTGYNENGYLKLSNNNGSSYDYYVGDFGTDGYALILSSDDTESGYAVDERYDLYTVSDGKYTAVSYRETGDNGAYITSNVFYKDATFTVYPTSYLWLVKSENGGETWSAPQILNPQVKGEDEAFYGVGPGRGLVASDGTIYFSCYQHGGVDITWGSNVEKSSLIYSKDGGKTWKRTNDLDDAGGGWRSYWSSENQAVQLNDGTIRMFYRNGRGVMCYVDLNDNGSWGSPVSLESTMASIGNQYICSSCQLSVIHYSETIDGKEAILVSCPSAGSKGSTGERENGKIFVFTVNADNTLTAAYSYQVNTGAFQYSCLTELSDGSIGILYENGAASIVYENIAIETIAPNAVIGNGEEESTPVTDTNDIPLDGTSVNLAENGEAKTISVKLSDGQTLSANSSNTNVVTASVTNNQVTLTPVGAGSTTVTLTVSSMSRAAGGTATATLNVTVASADVIDMGTIDLAVGGSKTVSIPADVAKETPVYGKNGIVTAKVGEATSTTTDEGYLLGNSTNLSNGTYVIASGSNAITSGLGNTSGVSTGSVVDANAVWTITQSGDGYKIRNVDSERYLYLQSGDWGRYSLSTTSNSSSATTWTWSNNKFSANVGWFDTTYYLQYSNGSWSANRNSSSTLTIYPATYQSGETTWTTPVTFTGMSVGTTTVTIGNYRHTVNVSEKPPFDESAYTIISNTGDPSYSKGREVEYLILTPGMTYDLNLDGDYTSVSWSSSNGSVATVGSNDGTVRAVSAGNTTITADITTADGSGTKTVYVTVLDTIGYGTSRKVEFYVAELTNSRLYYHQNKENNPYLVEVKEHTVFYMDTAGLWAMTFFGAPIDDSYAMTCMSAANNYDQSNWYVIEDNVLATSTTFYQNKGSLSGTYGYSQTELTTMINNAKKQGSDGGFWFTRGRGDNGNCQAYLIVISEPLPTVKKEITSVTHNGQSTPYTDGMAIYAGDTINYNIAVTTYGSEYGITYSNATLTETLAPFTDGAMSKRISLTDRDDTQTFAASYTVKATDIGKDLTNKVSFAYSYKAKYSTGSMTASAEAAASITVLPFTPKNYVVDFGLPVTFDFSDQITEAMGNITFESASSEQGADVSVSGQTVTYQIKKPFTGVDTVSVNLTSGGTMSFHVYPATTVYYDANFVEGISTTGMTVFYQTATAVGAETFNYGYQKDYSNSASGTLTGEATFTFTGTGVDIYTNPTSNSCYVAVRIYDSKGDLVHLYVVDTAMKAGTNTTYTSVPDSAYNVPIVSELGLERDTYTVEIERVNPDRGFGTSNSAANRTAVTLNGFRVYGTLANGADNGVYTQDNESKPTFTQLRDVLINTLWKTYSGAVKLDEQYDQVYSPYTGDMEASINDLTEAADAQDLLINGPKNEIYLTGNQTLTITVPTSGEYQIGLKALDSTSGKVKINDKETDVTNVDMFYEVTVDSNKKITIKNTSESAMIAVTYLKKTV